MISQQDGGHSIPLLVMKEKQHCPLGATHSTGLMHSDRAIRPAPAPAVPSRPSPARAGMTPAVPRPPAAPRPAAPRAPPATLLAILLAASRANPPDQTVRVMEVFRF